jgi:hypothetical protein
MLDELRAAGKAGVPELYAARLSTWHDEAILRLCIQAVEDPAVRSDSFALHAPLEILNRYQMLSLASHEVQDRARIRMLEVAARYTTEVETVERAPLGSFHSASTAAERFMAAARAGDRTAADGAAQWLALHASDVWIVKALVPLVLDSLAGAGHMPILLNWLVRMPVHVSKPALVLLRHAAVRLSEAPDQRAQLCRVVLEGGTGTLQIDQVWAALAPLSKKAPPAPTGGLYRLYLGAAPHLPEALSFAANVAWHQEESCGAAFAGACRAAAASMLGESSEHTKYGWTHALNLPDSLAGLCGIAAPTERGAAATLALAWAWTFRFALGQNHLRLPTPPRADFHLERWMAALESDPTTAGELTLAAPAEQRSTLQRHLASAAAAHEDAHFSKYVRSCFDAAARDPAAAALYLAASARLAATWLSEGRK